MNFNEYAISEFSKQLGLSQEEPAHALVESFATVNRGKKARLSHPNWPAGSTITSAKKRILPRV